MSYNYKTISNNPEERQRVLYPYCYWENSFSSEELDAICKLSEKGLKTATIAGKEDDGTVTSPKLDTEVRSSSVAFHTVTNDNKWIFDRINSVVEIVNARWYNFDLNGYDQYQYTEYYSKDNGHYDWHVDTHFGPQPKNSYSETRKLSLTLLLNDPDKDFTGGELQIGNEKNYESVNAKRGTMILFPSFQLHRVAPVTRGIRKSLVVWVLGPKFR